MRFGLSNNVINSIQKVFENNPKIDEAVLFGSRAKGNYRDGSDIDLAIKGRNISFNDILRSYGQLDDLNMPYEIDLLNYSTIKDKAVVEHIDRVGIVFFKRRAKVRLGDYVDVISGYAFKSSNFLNNKTDNALPVIKIKNVANGDVHLNDVQYHLYEPSLKKFLIEKDDILIALTGNHPEVLTQVVGDASLYKLHEKALLNQRVAKIVAKEGLNKGYLYYFLKDDVTHNALASNSAGSANQANVSKTDVENLPMLLPPLGEQTSIANTLCSLDDKIDLLQRQNKTLEQLAETLFRQWFLEEADESWEVVKVSDLANINKLAITKNYPFTEIEYLDTGSITEGVITSFESYNLSDAPSRAQRIVDNNDIVYSLVRPIQRHHGLLHNIKPNTIVSTGFCVITGKGISPYVLYLLLTRNEAVEYFDMIAEGSTSAYPSLKPSDIANFEFQKPPEGKLQRFQEVSSDTWNKIKSNTNQISNLTELRDTLLPKLMSGEVRVKN